MGLKKANSTSFKKGNIPWNKKYNAEERKQVILERDRKRSKSKKRKEYMNNYLINYYEKNREQLLEYKKEYGKTNLKKLKEKSKIYYKNHPDKYKKLLEKKKLWSKNHPHSSKKYSLELQISMNNVRIRDKNTCQWYKCGKKYLEIEIHVHHIFPRKEYPDLELVEQYMICYCKTHHILWHKIRKEHKRRVENNERC